jgi:hypothetical protein
MSGPTKDEKLAKSIFIYTVVGAILSYAAASYILM